MLNKKVSDKPSGPTGLLFLNEESPSCMSWTKKKQLLGSQIAEYWD